VPFALFQLRKSWKSAILINFISLLLENEQFQLQRACSVTVATENDSRRYQAWKASCLKQHYI